MDRLESMAVFVKAADLGSFTAAAATLGLSSQMVGKHVAALEARLGAELIRRTTRRQSLTAIGQAFYDRCRTILSETEAAETLALDHGTNPRGLLRVNAPVAFGAACLAPLVRAYLEKFPDVAVELTLNDRFVDVIDEGYDVAIRFGPLDDSSLLSRTLAPHRLVVCAAPAYLAAHGTPATPEDLAAHDCPAFVYSTGVTLADWEFGRGRDKRTVRISSRLRSNDTRVLLAAALAGEGILLQGERVVRDHLAAGRLVQILSEYEAPCRPVHALFSPSRRQTPALRAFLDLVAETLG